MIARWPSSFYVGKRSHEHAHSKLQCQNCRCEYTNSCCVCLLTHIVGIERFATAFLDTASWALWSTVGLPTSYHAVGNFFATTIATAANYAGFDIAEIFSCCYNACCRAPVLAVTNQKREFWLLFSLLEMVNFELLPQCLKVLWLSAPRWPLIGWVRISCVRIFFLFYNFLRFGFHISLWHYWCPSLWCLPAGVRLEFSFGPRMFSVFHLLTKHRYQILSTWRAAVHSFVLLAWKLCVFWWANLRIPVGFSTYSNFLHLGSVVYLAFLLHLRSYSSFGLGCWIKCKISDPNTDFFLRFLGVDDAFVFEECVSSRSSWSKSLFCRACMIHAGSNVRCKHLLSCPHQSSYYCCVAVEVRNWCCGQWIDW